MGILDTLNALDFSGDPGQLALGLIVIALIGYFIGWLFFWKAEDEE
jgi:hypothetical protein